MSVVSLEQQFRSAQGLDVQSIRSAIVTPPPGVFFGIRLSAAAPFALLGLYLDFERLIDDPLRSTDDTLLVDVTEVLNRAQEPFTIRWTVLAGHPISTLATYLLSEHASWKLGLKPAGLQMGESWHGGRTIGSRHTVAT